MPKVIAQKTVDEYGDDGEIKRKTTTAIVGRPSKWESDGDFLKLYPAFFHSFLKQINIDDARLRLVAYLLNEAMKLRINGDNAVFLDHNKAAADINISMASLYRHIKTLIDCEFIKQINPRQSVYIINPEMVYKGNLVRYFQKESERKGE